MIIVDTCVWSTVLRMPNPPPRIKEKFIRIVTDGQAVIIGAIRQEILSGIKDKKKFKKTSLHLNAFTDLPLNSDHYEIAASYYNLCRSVGIQGSNTDFLICAAAVGFDCPIFTTDKDFTKFNEHLPIVLV